MKVLLSAAAMVALFVAGTAHAQTGTSPTTRTFSAQTVPGTSSDAAGTGTPSISNPTVNTTIGTATGDNPPGSVGSIAPGMQNSGSTTGQAGD